MAAVQHFRELKVYRAALRQAEVLFCLTRGFPKEETYSLTDQVRRSSRAVGALLAEAWGRRRYPAAFKSKVSEALGEVAETQAWLDHAHACGYLSEEQHQELWVAWDGIGGMLCGVLRSADMFCRNVAIQR